MTVLTPGDIQDLAATVDPSYRAMVLAGAAPFFYRDIGRGPTERKALAADRTEAER